MNSRVATISKEVSGGEELVVITRKDFELFQKWQEEINEALAKVTRGREEYRKKKTIVVSSPRRFRS